MRRLTSILFDLDGTLTDSKDGIIRCIRFSLDQLGVPSPAETELTWCVGPPLRESFSRLIDASDHVLLDRALFFYRERFAEVGMHENAVYPGTLSALERIKSTGLRLFLATAKLRVFAEPILDHFRLTQFFHGVYGSELDGRLSDKGELIAHIIGSEGLDTATTLMVGDRSHDILAGKQNGIMTAAVTYGYGSQEEISASSPDFVFDSLSDLAILLETHAVGPSL